MINVYSRKIASRLTNRTHTVSFILRPIGRRCASPRRFSNPYGGVITYPRERLSSQGTRSISFAVDWCRPKVIFQAQIIMIYIHIYFLFLSPQLLIPNRIVRGDTRKWKSLRDQERAQETRCLSIIWVAFRVKC